MIFAWLLALVPISLALRYVLHVPSLWLFITAVLAIVPLAEWIRRATEQMARIAGPAIGGLLNVTFGNLAELILALFVLQAGQQAVVKGQITGSIVGNGLLGLGAAAIAGGIGREQQRFSRERAGLLSSLLVLSVIALLVPAVFDYTERGRGGAALVADLDDKMSLGVATVLILVYVANLVYTLVTNRDTYRECSDDGETGSTAHREDRGKRWSLWLALGVLVGATAFTALEAEIVSGALENTAGTLGVTTFFLGVVVLAIIGNAAEYLSAIYFARQNRMGMVMSITVGSSIQIALFTAPVLVIVSHFFGTPMNLVFANPIELVAIAAVAFAVNAIAEDGETTWMEGVLLVGTYAVLAVAFFFVTT